MQSRETGRMTKTKSSSNPIAPSEPQQWGSFRFRNTAFSTNRNARACRGPFPTDATGNRLTAPAHTETRPAPPSKGTDRYNLKRASFVSMMCIRAVVRLALFHGPRTDARCSHR